MADQPPAAKPRSRTRLIIQTSVSLVLVVAIFYYLLRGIDLALVWAQWTSPREVDTGVMRPWSMVAG
jgi:hypothetical protein